MSDEKPKGKQLNFNTFLSMILLGVLIWVGTSIQSASEKLSRLSERLAVLETTNGMKFEQLNRIEGQLTKQQVQINDMALDLARLKVGKP